MGPVNNRVKRVWEVHRAPDPPRSRPPALYPRSGREWGRPLADFDPLGFQRRELVPGLVPPVVRAGEPKNRAAGLLAAPDAEEVGTVAQDVLVAGVAEPKRAFAHPTSGRTARLDWRRRRTRPRLARLAGALTESTSVREAGRPADRHLVRRDPQVAVTVAAQDGLVLDLLRTVRTFLHGVLLDEPGQAGPGKPSFIHGRRPARSTDRIAALPLLPERGPAPLSGPLPAGVSARLGFREADSTSLRRARSVRPGRSSRRRSLPSAEAPPGYRSRASPSHPASPPVPRPRPRPPQRPEGPHPPGRRRSSGPPPPPGGLS